MSKVQVGCSKPVGSNAEEAQPEVENVASETSKGAGKMIKAGQKAPDFSAMAYQDGGFKEVKLSDYLKQVGCALFLPR